MSSLWLSPVAKAVMDTESAGGLLKSVGGAGIL